LYVHGEHLIRARDVNLPQPTVVSYPVFDSSGKDFLGTYYDVDSFSGWETANSTTCPFPPCVASIQRPISQVGAINVFESAADSIYHGVTLSLHRRVNKGLYFRAGFTWAQAIDDGQDALVTGRPATVQNSYATGSEKGWSTTDQRHRFVGALTYESGFFNHDQNVLRAVFNRWKMSALTTYGSGRPVSAQIVGDANADGNTSNDRLPGYRRNAFLGPDYMTTDLRVTRTFRLSDRIRLELIAESFNSFNRDNKRLEITDDGFGTTAASFMYQDTTIAARHYPAQYRMSNGFLVPSSSYAPRQVQFALRVLY
jgi:hypothetical protein